MREQRPFLSALLVGVVLYFIAGRIPVINGMAGWAALAAAAYLYTKWASQRMSQVGSAVGYGAGIGAILGASVNLIGVILNMAYAAVILSASTHAISQAETPNAAAALAGFGASFSMASNFVHLFAAPIVGGFWGALGGLIGASMRPK